ncbi:hypothetical protein BZL30_8055 [Mycobacterium kansasii]|uniref:Uncharacterized protein n=1 Tax=Mycobacterium kansasii TaxID=1768 RepID=A0A1V3WIF2_MYCKA|nr:hypothetical protein BZL30_8055 [Mycobacterium kansasii]
MRAHPRYHLPHRRHWLRRLRRPAATAIAHPEAGTAVTARAAGPLPRPALPSPPAPPSPNHDPPLPPLPPAHR